MKLKTSISLAIWFVTVFSTWGQVNLIHRAAPAPNPLNYQQSPNQWEIDQANLRWQQQQAAIAAQKAAEREATNKAIYDAAVEKLADERTDAISKLNAKYNPIIADLDSQASIPKSRIQRLEQERAELERQKSQYEAENTHLRAKQLFLPKDPWRLLDGKVCNAKDESWVQFTGQILEVKSHGILVNGDFGPPLEAGFGERVFFVDNFPIKLYPMADGENVSSAMNFVAHLGTTSSIYQYTNTTIDLHVNTVRRLDYGKIVDSPPPDLVEKWNNIPLISDDNPQITKELNDNQNEQAVQKNQLSEIEFKLSGVQNNYREEMGSLVAEFEAKLRDLPNALAKQAKDKEDEKKRTMVAKTVAFNQAQADQGDPVGLLRMGERYRDGDGVPKDLAKARDYLTKAVAAGEPSAADELSKLNQNAAQSEVTTNSP